MKASIDRQDQFREKICGHIAHRAGNLFLTRQLWCSGAVLVVLNQGLDGDLTQDQAIRLAAGLGDGMGGAGCLCGGLNGAALALGLLLGNGRLSRGGDQTVLEATRWIHDQFKKTHGSTCCKVLMKKDQGNPKTQYQACADRTACAAGLATRIILQHRPELIERVDWDYLKQEDGKVGAGIKIMADRLRKP